MSKDTSAEDPWHSGGKLHPVLGTRDPQLADAQRVWGEDFEPVDLSELEGADPHLEDVGEQMRRLRDALTGIADNGADLAEAAELLRRAADIVEPQSPDQATRLASQWRKGGPGARRTNPVGGTENVIAPPLRAFGNPDGSVSARITLGLPYQGPPGCVHGGMSALMLDHLFGFANHWVGLRGMTAHYEIDYRKPTPLLEPLDMKAWVESHEGRKIWVRATIESGGELRVEARALFISANVPLPGRDATAPGEER